MRNLLLSTVTISLVPAVSVASPEFNISTHTTPIELKPISQLDLAYKTAGVCFLGVGDCDPNIGYGKGEDDYTVDTAAQCKNEGFILNNCNSVQVPEGICPYNSSYITRCKCATNLVSCAAGQVGVGESCGGQYASCKCDPNLVTCASNQIGQGASCGGKYQSCVCKSEYVYTSSNCTSPRSVSGSSCGGKYTDCSCPTGVSAGTYGCAEYYPSPCSYVCKKAYTDNCHKRSDNNSAVYGCMKYWSDCSSKCETPYTDNCRNRTAVISSCPTNANCSYFSDCSSKISSWSCKPGYITSGNSCINPCDNRVNQSCAYGCQTYWSDCPSKCQTCKGNPDCDVASKTCDYGCASTNSCGKCTACKSCSNTCSTGSTSSSCSSGYHAEAVGSTQCGNTCYSCVKDDNPCDNRTNQTCSYGCQTYYSDCSSKCQTCYPDNCRNRTAVIDKCPTDAICKYFSDCRSKIESWDCDQGYKKEGNTCVSSSPEPDPCDSVTAVSVPAHASCSAHYSSCSSKCSAWTCDSGYVKSGNSCIEEQEPEPSSPSSSPEPSPSEPSTPTGPTEAECRRRYPDYDECAERGPCTCDRRMIRMPGDCSAYYYEENLCASW